MRVVTMTVSRNEADILEAFVRHHAEFCHMVIYITRCSDNTAEIADALVREGLPVEFHEYHGGEGETQGTRRGKRAGRHTFRVAGFLTLALRDLAKRFNPDWILPIDTDEFVATTRGTPSEALAELPPDAVVSVRRPSFIPTATDDQSERHVLRRILYRRLTDLPVPKAFVPGALARREDYRLSNGNHALLDNHDDALPMTESDTIFLGHFPVRTDRQLRAKVIGGYLAIASSPLASPQDAHQWRRLFARCSQPEPLTPEELGQIALFYPHPPDDTKPDLVREPLRTPPGDIRYPIAELEPWQVLVDSSVHLASEVNRLAGERLPPPKTSWLRHQLIDRWR